MKKFNNYDETKPYTSAERLPIGGYELKIMDAVEKNYQWGSVMVISFDIATGEQKDFFTNNYKNQQGEDRKWKGTFRLNIPTDDGSEADTWRKRKFKTVMNAIEDSNPGFHWSWDEKQLKGKLVGGIFNNKEYEYNGSRGFFTNCHSLVTIETIRNGKYEIPADTLLKGARPSQQENTDFMTVPDDGMDELPFN